MSGRTRFLSMTTTLAVLLFLAFVDNFTQVPMIAPYATDLGATTVMAGWIVSIYSLTNLIGNIGAGWILDTFGRRVPLAVGLAWAGFGLWTYGFVGTPLGLLGARAFHGLGGSVLVPAIFTLAADTIPATQRTKGMARIGAMIGLAAVVGPMLSGVLRQLSGPRAVFTTVFVLMLAGAFIALTLPETLTQNPRRKTGKASAKPDKKPHPEAATTVGSRAVSFTAAPFQIANAAGFAASFGMGAVTLMLPLQMEQLGFAASRAAGVFSIFAVVAVSAMFGVGRSRGGVHVIIPGLSAVAAGFAVLSLGTSFAVSAVGMAIFGLGFGLIYPTVNAQVALLFDVEQRGRAYGIFYAFFSLGVVLAPPLVGWLSAFTSTAGIYVSFAVVAALLAAFLYGFRHLLTPTEPGYEIIE